MSEAALHGDLIEIPKTPPRGLSTESHIAKILVAYKGSVLWAIPLQECRTWFVSHESFTLFPGLEAKIKISHSFFTSGSFGHLTFGFIDARKRWPPKIGTISSRRLGT
jgi:hypothetical protein